MTWQVIGGLQTLIAQVRAEYGNMLVGTIGDTAHQTETSDHNPDSNGNVCAADFMIGSYFTTYNAAELVTELIIGQDRRLHYVIYNGRIYTSEHEFTSEVYDGTDKHTNHVHVSVNHNNDATNTREWNLLMLTDNDIQRIVDALTKPTPILDDNGKVNGVETPIGKAVMNTGVPMDNGKRGYVWQLLNTLYTRK
jgi:hypothetical protein